ncbi:MAG: FG-GAP-like repeat-containing protein, partial [Bacteroidetes bacterium]|nr:FG-GAP-like repeat-containing protein [Bacteroidota bacterium]
MRYKFSILICITFLIIFSGCKEKSQETPAQYWDILSTRILGLSYLEENKLDEAEAEFLKLVKLAPDEVMGYANLGLVYLRKGNYDDAKKQLDIALRIESDNPDARFILAEYYKLTDNYEASIDQLKNIIEIDPGNKRALYSLVEIYSRVGLADGNQLQAKYLNSLVGNVPNNIVPRMELIEILLNTGKDDQALLHLEQIRQQFPEFPKEAAEFYNKALEYLHAFNPQEALKVIRIFHNFLKVTTLYQSDLRDIAGPGGARVGFPVITFSQLFTAEIPEGKSIIDAISFTEVTSDEGLDVVNQNLIVNHQAKDYYSYLAIGDYDGDGDQDAYFTNFKEGQETNFYLLRNQWAGRGGMFEDVTNNSGIDHGGEEYSSIFADYDNDGWLDLYIVKNGANLLYQNDGEGSFVDVSVTSKLDDQSIGSIPLFFDIDHDGDLDVFIANQGRNLLYRNNSDGTFLEQSKVMGVAGENIKSRDAAFGDFDEDGDIDLLVINQNASNVLYENQRQGRFEDNTEASGLANKGYSGAVAIGDYNNDGFLDFFITALEEGSYQLLKNKGNGAFEEDNQIGNWANRINRLIGYDAKFFDFDNDGFLDLLIAGKSTERGVFLLHNDGSGNFEDVSHLLPVSLESGRQIEVTDYDEDGDLD